MTYKVFFASGESVSIDQDLLRELNQALAEDKNYPIVGAKGVVIFTEYVTHIIPDDSLDQPSGVINAPTPDSIKEEQKQEHERIVGSPEEILGRIKEREKENDPNVPTM